MTSRFRVIEGGRTNVTPFVLPDDPFVLEPGLTQKTEMQVIGSALNEAFAKAMKGEYDTANKILAGVRDAITRMSKRRK